MPETDRPLAPLLTMTEYDLANIRACTEPTVGFLIVVAELDAQRAARATAEEQSQALKIACDNLRWVADAEAKAHATAYAEGQRTGLQQAIDACRAELSVDVDGRLENRLRALRDTPAPPREEPT